MSAEAVNESLLRLVIIDYPKLLLNNSTAYSIFGNMIQCRQSNFLRTSDTFLVIDKHDLIGTHFLVYDTRNLFSPTLVAGFRITYEERARKHGLEMPIESLLRLCDRKATEEYSDFCQEKGQSIQFNTLYIEPNYTFSKSSLRLSDMLFFGVCAYIRRLGFNYYVGATNDRLKTDRWMNRAGIFTRPTYPFNHPDVGDPHTLFFIDAINDQWLSESFQAYGHYWKNAWEFIPNEISRKSFTEVAEELGKPPAGKFRAS